MENTAQVTALLAVRSQINARARTMYAGRGGCRGRDEPRTASIGFPCCEVRGEEHARIREKGRGRGRL